MDYHPNPVPRPPVPGPPMRPSGFEQLEPQQTDPTAGIDEAVSGLDDLESVPLAEHVERFETVHSELTVALSSIDKV